MMTLNDILKIIVITDVLVLRYVRGPIVVSQLRQSVDSIVCVGLPRSVAQHSHF
jgi:hypothetical protein